MMQTPNEATLRDKGLVQLTDNPRLLGSPKSIFCVFSIILTLSACHPSIEISPESEIYDSILRDAITFNHGPIAITTTIEPENIYFNIDASTICSKYEVAANTVELGPIENKSFYVNGLRRSIEKNQVRIDSKSKYWVYLIGFDKTGTIAIVYEHNNLIPRAGYGVFHVFQLKDGHWTKKEEQLHWIS